MKGLGIFFLVLAGLLFINNIIATFEAWNALLGLGGILISIFLMPLAIIAWPIVAAKVANQGFFYALGCYIFLGIMVCFFYLGGFLIAKADERKQRKLRESVEGQLLEQRIEERKAKLARLNDKALSDHQADLD